MHELRTEPRQRRSQQSIDSILDAAERLIHDQGQVGFTANELAAAAHMSIGRVYYWFPDIPSVVNALVDRSVSRMAQVLGAAFAEHRNAATPLLLQRAIDALCAHVDANPATVPLCLSGGPRDPGQKLFSSLVDVAQQLLGARVPDLPDAESLIVSRTAVGIVLGMMHGYTEAGEFKDYVKQEMVYVLAAWLVARYPAQDDPVWHNPNWAVQPSRPSTGEFQESYPVWPALAPAQPPS